MGGVIRLIRLIAQEISGGCLDSCHLCSGEAASVDRLDDIKGNERIILVNFDRSEIYSHSEEWRNTASTCGFQAERFHHLVSA